MQNNRQIPRCGVCKIELEFRANRGKQASKNIVCSDCAKRFEKECPRCGIIFCPTALKGTRFAYCLDCARAYQKEYKRSGNGIKPLLKKKECLWCLKEFDPLSFKSKCCSRACNNSHNMHMRLGGSMYRSSRLTICKCGKLISNMTKHCPQCKSSICSVENCDVVVRSQGLCNKHLLRLKRRGDVNAERLPRERRARCSIERCKEAEREDGLCLVHLKHKKNESGPFRKPKLCSYSNCDMRHHGKGLCSFHYTRLINGFDLDAPRFPNKKYHNLICLHDGCDKPNAGQGHGLCKSHFRAKTRRRYKTDISWQALGPKVNWVCHLCGEQVEQIAGTWQSPQGANVDHLIPRSKGGSDNWDNVLLAHYSCNHKRSDTEIKTNELKKKIAQARFASLDKVFK